jgi:hypothetical protein
MIIKTSEEVMGGGRNPILGTVYALRAFQRGALLSSCIRILV